MILLKELRSPDLSINNIDINNLKIFFQSKVLGYTSYVFPEDILKKISSLFKEEFLTQIQGIYLQVITPAFNGHIQIAWLS
jgi:hypothetical protein